MILFTGGVCLSAYWDATPAGSRHPPEQTPPWEQTPPQEQTPPGSRHSPRSRHPPGADTPQEQTTLPRADTPHRADTPLPREQSMLRDTVNARAVRILLECNLVKLLIYYLKQIKMLEFGDQNSGLRIHNGFQDQFRKWETSCFKRKYSISSVCCHFTI